MSLVNTPYMSTLERPNRVPAESCVVTGPVMSPRKMELWTCGCSQGVSKHADSGPEEAQVASVASAVGIAAEVAGARTTPKTAARFAPEAFFVQTARSPDKFRFKQRTAH